MGQKINIQPGILKPILKMMKNAALPLDKICTLSFDEKKVRGAYGYSQSADTSLCPAANVQVAKFTCIFGNWKQPIFSTGGAPLSCRRKRVYIQIIVSDLNATNQALHRELGVTFEKLS